MSQPFYAAPASHDPDDPHEATFTDHTLRALAAALPSPDTETAEQQHRRRTAAFNALQSFDTHEPIDAMLATQAVVAHHFAMECYRRAALSSHTPHLNTRLLGTAAMLCRTMSAALQAIDQRQDEPVWVGRPDIP